MTMAMDSHGNIGNPANDITATPQSVLGNVSVLTRRYEGVAPGIVNILYNMQAQINTLQTALHDLQTTFNGHVHSGITAGTANSGASTTTSNDATGSQLNVL